MTLKLDVLQQPLRRNASSKIVLSSSSFSPTINDSESPIILDEDDYSNSNNSNNSTPNNISMGSINSFNNYNYGDLLKTPNHFFSPSTGKMNHRNNSNIDLNSNGNGSGGGYIEEDENQEEQDVDIDLSVLNLNFNNIIKDTLNSSSSSSSSSSTISKTTIMNNKYSINKKINKTGGKHGNVFFVNNNNNNNNINEINKCNKSIKTPTQFDTFAVKQQIISTPHNKLSQSYREKVILDHLKKLIQSNKTCNFVELVNWYKATPSIPPLELSEQDDDTEESEDEDDYFDEFGNICIESKAPVLLLPSAPTQYMHFILEYADLKSFSIYKQNKEFKLHQIKSLLFQVIYALAIAQKEFEFVHNDLHFGNILLKSFPAGKKYIVYQDKCESNGNNAGKGDNKNYHNWIVGEWIIKISDFGLSRIKIPSSDEIIYNQRNKYSKSFFFHSDLSAFSSLIQTIKIVDLSSPENAADKKSYTSIKKKMKELPPYLLLEHPFFYSLKTCPKDCTIDNSIRISTDGVIPLEFPTPPPSLNTVSKSDGKSFKAPLQSTKTPIKSTVTTTTPFKTPLPPINKTPHKTPLSSISITSVSSSTSQTPIKTPIKTPFKTPFSSTSSPTLAFKTPIPTPLKRIFKSPLPIGTYKLTSFSPSPKQQQSNKKLPLLSPHINQKRYSTPSKQTIKSFTKRKKNNNIMYKIYGSSSKVINDNKSRSNIEDNKENNVNYSNHNIDDQSSDYDEFKLHESEEEGQEEKVPLSLNLVKIIKEEEEELKLELKEEKVEEEEKEEEEPQQTIETCTIITTTTATTKEELTETVAQKSRKPRTSKKGVSKLNNEYERYIKRQFPNGTDSASTTGRIRNKLF